MSTNPPLTPQVADLIASMFPEGPPAPPPVPPPPELSLVSREPFDAGSRPLDALGGLILDLFSQAQDAPEAQAPQPETALQSGLGPAALIALAASKAAEQGLEFGTGRLPGSLFFKGPQGEKLALNAGKKFLDLISFGKGKTKTAQPLLDLFDTLASQAELQGRRGTTPLTTAGQKSIERAVEQGFLTKNPAGKGFLSTAQPQGLSAFVDDIFRGLQKFGPLVNFLSLDPKIIEQLMFSGLVPQENITT